MIFFKKKLPFYCLVFLQAVKARDVAVPARAEFLQNLRGELCVFCNRYGRYFYLGRCVVQLLVGEEPEEFVRRCAIDLRSFHTL